MTLSGVGPFIAEIPVILFSLVDRVQRSATKYISFFLSATKVLHLRLAVPGGVRVYQRLQTVLAQISSMDFADVKP
jgi:hypothetical protein